MYNCTLNSEIWPDLIDKFDSLRTFQFEIKELLDNIIIYEDNGNNATEAESSKLVSRIDDLRIKCKILEKEILTNLIDLKDKGLLN